MSVDQLSAYYQLPSGFQELTLLGMLTVRTIDIILQIQKTRKGLLYQIGHSHRSFGDGKSYKYDNLAEACPGLTIPDGADGPALERLLCTLLMRLSIEKTHRYGHPGSLFETVTIKLFKLLPLATPSLGGPGRSCILWISLMMTDSWPRQGDKIIDWLQQVRSWFPEIRAWEASDFEKFGERYIWAPEISRLMERYWPVVQDEGDDSASSF
jgi:hypothetical protein